MIKRLPEGAELVLISHIAVDYVRMQGVDIGIAQRVECTTTGMIVDDIVENEERKYGIKRQNFTAENVKTPERTHMLALLYALRLARRTIKKTRPEAVQLEKVKIFCSSPKVVHIVNHHIEHAPLSLEDVASTNDQLMIKRVVASVRKLSRKGLGVSIAIVDNAQDQTAARAGKMAKRKGRNACRTRHRQWLVGSDTLTEAQEEVGNEAA